MIAAQLRKENEMPEVTAIGELISKIGFPIVAAIALFWYMNKQRETHKAETDGMKDALNENTKILAELKELISFLMLQIKKEDPKNGI